MNLYQTILKRIVMFLQISLVAFTAVLSVQAAGEVDPTFNTNVGRFTQASSNALALQPDGKILVGGDFKLANGLTRIGIARFNTDGSLDTSFSPSDVVNQNDPVRIINVITLQADGKIFIGGSFNSIAGVSRGNLARLNPDGSLDTSFVQGNNTTSSINGIVNAITVLSDGKVLVGGTFTISVIIQGLPVTRANLVRFNSDGTFDSSFELNPTGNVADIVLQPDGKIIIGGGFGFVARLNPNGTIDSTFFLITIQNGSVQAIVLQPDGKVVVVGSFTSYGGVSQGRITRLNSDGTLDTTFNINNPGANGPINDAALAPDGKIIIVGNFTNYNNVARRNFARLNIDGSLDTSFTYSGGPTSFSPNDVVVQTDGRIIIAGTNSDFRQPGAVFRLNQDGSLDTSFAATVYSTTLANVYDLSIQPDGKILVGGDFTVIGGVPRAYIARLNIDGTVDTSFVPNLSVGTGVGGGVLDIATQADGKVVVAGQIASHVQRLNADGSRDTTFLPPVASSGIISAIEIQASGKILFAGNVSSSFQGIGRLNTNGTVDTSFINTVGDVQDIVLQSDGKIVIGGGFTTINGISRGRIARLNADGSLDNSFNPPFGVGNGSISTLTLQPDGRIIAGGQFSVVNGLSRNNLARFNSDGSLDTSFAPNPNLQVLTVLVQPDGRILVGGLFTLIDGVPRNRYARLNTNGTVDLSFNSSVGANQIVSDIVLQLDGRILIGGSFTQVGGQPHLGLARLLNSNAATRTPFDFDGDGRADLTVFRASNGFWYELSSQNNSFIPFKFGQNGDRIAPADYDGDGRTDFAVWRDVVFGAGNKAYFYITNSSDGSFRPEQFGATGDVPVSGDWDGDGKADLAVYRDGSLSGGQGYFFYRPSSAPGVDFRAIAWGTNGDKPLVGDFDGDGKQDAAVFRPSAGTWYILQSSNNQYVFQGLGIATDIPVPADYDGDGRTNIAVFRPSNGTWYTSPNPQTNYGAVQFGAAGDLPVPADYDGDGRADIAVFRPSNGTWYLLRTSQGFTGVQFGNNEDKPIPNAYIR